MERRDLRHVPRAVQRVAGLWDLCFWLRHVSSVLPDVHGGEQLQRERCVGDGEYEHWLQLYVPESVARRPVQSVPRPGERDRELWGVHCWLRGLPELHPNLQRE